MYIQIKDIKYRVELDYISTTELRDILGESNISVTLSLS